jgi:hypothetical protein
MRGHRHRKAERERFIVEKEETKRLIDEKEIVKEDLSFHEDECCSCREAWKAYKSCLELSYIGTRKFCISVKNAIYNCFGACCFPIKERCCNCCDEIDKDLNPYKNPNYNPYDYL